MAASTAVRRVRYGRVRVRVGGEGGDCASARARTGIIEIGSTCALAAYGEPRRVEGSYERRGTRRA